MMDKRDHENMTRRELDRLITDKKLHRIVGNLVLVEDEPRTTEFTDEDKNWLASCGISA